MKFIREKYLSDKQVLFLDEENKLYLYGHRANDILGIVIKDNSIGKMLGPYYTGITLDKDDNIKKFYYRDYYFVVHTIKGKLYLSRSIISKYYISPFKNNNSANLKNIFKSNSDSDDNESNDSDTIIDLSSDSEDDAITITSSTTANESDSDSDDTDEDQSDGEYYDFYYYDHLPNFEFDVEKKFICSKKYDDQNLLDFKEMNIDIESKYEESSDININIDYNFTYDNGIDLFGENIKNIALIDNLLFFNIDENLFMLNINNHNDNKIESDFLPMRSLLFKKNKIIGNVTYTYYQLIFPFTIDNLYFCDKFIYFTSNQYHNILFTTFSSSGYELEWIYFATQINFHISDILVSNKQLTVFIKQNNAVYKYVRQTNSLEKFLEYDNVNFEKNIKGEKIMLCRINESVYKNSHGLNILQNIYRGKYYKEVIDVVDIAEDWVQNVVLIKGGEKKLMFIEDKQFYLNVDKTICYNYEIYNYITFCSEDIIYFICSEAVHKKSRGNLKFYKRYHTKNKEFTYYVYSFKLPFEILDIKISDKIMLFKSNEKYYYLETQKINNFIQEINFDIDFVWYNNLIIESIVKRNTIEDNSDYLHLKFDTNSKRITELDKMLILAESVNKYTDVTLTYINGDNVASGDGCKIQFMNNAVKLFKEKYLIEFGSRTKFNLEEFLVLTDNELKYIGSMLHMIMYHTKNNLSIRLPLTFLTAILKRSPMIEELEFFASKEFKSVFNEIYKSKSNIEYIKSIGFESYYDCLRNMCGYYNDENTEINNQIKHISRKLADGFMEFDVVTNLRRMNLPTLDFYISGNYSLDRNRLVKNMKIKTIDNKSKIKTYKKNIINIIQEIPENKLATLLENWSSNSVIQDGVYFVQISKSICGIRFFTCTTELHINNDMFLPENENLLMELLTSPINSIQD
ncbi:putative KilA-N domain-containing protein [Moumouvirus australiensis]|uniref:Putative KilA-N domain-containing protein n=1 Tax=Moumouvirus australiensis TaxID=2109587 RepID=A0A2P1ELY7_9VIRU|nr:putative KilA-N domain-containing protein [Moumouvirus australiensis]AVL94868.1 putative KilA-N domain-containing protein [Moumouvirus australiensis]